MISFSVRAACASIALILSACGGGGGGGSGSSTNPPGGGGSTVPPPTSNSIVPAAPAVGATLFTDATVLRPAKLGSKWKYRVENTASVGATPKAYTSVNSLVAGGSTGVQGIDTREDGTVSKPYDLSVVGGIVKNSSLVDFSGKNPPEVVGLIELRSPVRQGDQYVSYERHYADSVVDADGDGKTDSLDVAIYGRVVGIETIALSNLPSMQALRVDTYIIVRAGLSSTSGTTPVLQSSLAQTWYVAGIGIVRQLTTSGAGNSTQTDDMKLVSWDAGDTGFGAMESVDAVIPQVNGVYPGQRVPGGNNLRYALGFDDHALLLSNPPNDPFPTSTLVTQFDMRGNVTESKILQGIRLFGVAASFSSGAVFIEDVSTSPGSTHSITRIDASGALVGAYRGGHLSLGGARMSSRIDQNQWSAAVDGNTLWVLWPRAYYDPIPGSGNKPGDEVILRAFNLDGSPVSPEIVVDTGAGSNTQLAVKDGKALFTWARSTGTNTSETMYGSATLAGLGFVRSLIPNTSVATPLRVGDSNALFWGTTLETHTNVGTSGALLLDSSLLPVKAGTTFLDDHVPQFPGVGTPKVTGNRLIVSGQSSVPLSPNDTSYQNGLVAVVAWMDVGTMPLAKTPADSVRFALPSQPNQSVKPVVLSDRVLFFSGENPLKTTVVWLGKGAKT